MRSLGKKKGFTLVELSLSIAFIAILSITIALIINDAISTYRRGLTLNQINTVGMDLVDDMRAAVQNSPATAVTDRCSEIYNNSFEAEKCLKDGARKFVVVERLASVKDVEDVEDKVPVFGAFCTGAYSYIWNSGYFDMGKVDEDGLNEATVTYTDKNDKTVPVGDFRLLKIKDKKRSVCISAVTEPNGQPREYPESNIDIESNFNISAYGRVTEEPELLLAAGDTNPLALYDLTAMTPVSNGVNASFYTVSFILGTVQGGINVMSNGNFCEEPNGYNSNFDYCAINKFNFAAQANGG